MCSEICILEDETIEELKIFINQHQEYFHELNSSVLWIKRQNKGSGFLNFLPDELIKYQLMKDFPNDFCYYNDEKKHTEGKGDIYFKCKNGYKLRIEFKNNKCKYIENTSHIDNYSKLSYITKKDANDEDLKRKIYKEKPNIIIHFTEDIINEKSIIQLFDTRKSQITIERTRSDISNLILLYKTETKLCFYEVKSNSDLKNDLLNCLSQLTSSASLKSESQSNIDKIKQPYKSKLCPKCNCLIGKGKRLSCKNCGFELRKSNKEDLLYIAELHQRDQNQ